MAWKGVHLSQPAYLSLFRKQLQIEFKKPDEREERLIRLPIEDIDYLILDTAEAVVSVPLMSALSSASVLVVGTSDKHMPSWASFPWSGYYQQGTTLQLQLKASRPVLKQLWRQVVRWKILHQAACLKIRGVVRIGVILEKVAGRVRTGDSANEEARAARVYWRHLFSQRHFVRHEADLPNALLNYGYALVRAAVARNLCALGFVPQLGIHHRGMGNAFNLADDLMEPYRPFVDYQVAKLVEGEPSDLEPTLEQRRALVSLLKSDVVMEGESIGFTVAIERSVNSFRKALRASDPSQILYPVLEEHLSLEESK